jgi:hypothetical protein
MADKKISALSAVSDSAIGADDLLHIVENPGGTPVNKKMTIGQLFENIPTHLAVDDIVTHTATSSTLQNQFTNIINGSGISSKVVFDLGSGTQTGQLMLIACSGMGGGGSAAITVAAYGGSPTNDTTEQITLDAKGEGCICMWNGAAWFVVANNGCTLT